MLAVATLAYTLGNIVFVLACAFLVMLILLRPSDSGGGLSGAFGGGGGGGDSPFGVRAVQTLDKVIAWTSGVLLALAVIMAWANRQ